MLDIVILLLKVFVIFSCSFFIFIKITNYKSITFYKTIIIILTCLLISLIYFMLKSYISVPFIVLIICFIISIIAMFLTKNKLDYTITAMIISTGISFLVFIVLTFLTLLFTIGILKIQDKETYDLYYILISYLFEFLFLYLFFRIRRFKNGFPFLNNKYISSFGIVFAGIALMIYTLFGNRMGVSFNTAMAIGTVICIIGIYIYIRRGIVMIYKNNMKDRTIELLQKEIEKKDKIIEDKDKYIEKIEDENRRIAKANHDINKRLSATERLVSQKLPFDTDLLEHIKDLSSEYLKGVSRRENSKINLPLTNITSIDAIFEYMAEEAVKNNIDFNLKLNDSIYYLIENIIPKNKLETMIGDHIQDAIVAVNSSSNVNRSILVLLGVLNNCYELCVSDTGIEFDIDVLIALGTKRITSHKDTGGSGIGFMTTFETIKGCGASLIIEEKSSPSSTEFTKSVSIRFDGKGQYVIKSHRADKIRSAVDDDRIIIKYIKGEKLAHSKS